MRMSTVTKNILTVIVAVLAFAGFVGLAEGVGGDKAGQDRLNALEATTTSTTEFVEPTTTSTTFFVDTTTTTAPVVTVTTSGPTTTVKTTATTKKPTTPTTKKTTVTTSGNGCPTSVPAPQNGSRNEPSDNQYAFTLPTGATSADPSPSASDPFSFTIKATPTSANGVHFAVNLQNNTARTLSFPSGLRIVVTVSQTGSSDQSYVLASSSFTSMACGEKDLVTSDGTVLGSGSFTASATADVDYGS